MPWTKADVDKHKKGLTDKQKEQWVAIANSTRASCLEEGKSEKECDALAIKIANGSVNTHTIMNQVIQANESYALRKEEKNGKTFLVAPVVMMVEGVHCGSHGCLFHPIEELGKFPEAWNGRPVVVYHPEKDGKALSAGNPEVDLTVRVGTVYNTYVDGASLKAEVWLEENKLEEISPEAFKYIKNGNPMDVSVGVFTDEEVKEGIWNGEKYTGIAHNHRFDHLALLPNMEGACNWADGCGIRLNKKGGTDVNLISVFKDLSKQGFAVSPIVNEVSLDGILDQIYMLTEGMSSNNTRIFPEQVYKDYFIYRKRKYTESAVGGEVSSSEEVGLFKQNYQIGADDKVTLVGDPVEVKKEVSYITLQQVNTTQTKIDNDKGGNVMTKKEKVDELISNEATHYSEGDREWLSTLDEKQLDKMAPKLQRNDFKPCCPDKVKELIKNDKSPFTEDDKDWLEKLNAEQLSKLFPKKEVTEHAGTPAELTKDNLQKVFSQYGKAEDFISLAPKEMQGQLTYGLNAYRAERKKMIDEISNNSQFTSEELEEMNDATLRKMHSSLVPEGDYSAKVSTNGGGGKKVTKEMMVMLGYKENDKKE